MSNAPNRRLHDDGGNGSGSGHHSHPSGVKYPNMLFRVPTPSDPSSGHAGAENKTENKELRENTKENKVENRESKPESKESMQTTTSEKHDGRVDDAKDTKLERESYSEVKGHEKLDKDAYGGSNSQWNWRDHKETYRAKQYSDASARKVEPWKQYPDASARKVDSWKQYPDASAGKVESWKQFPDASAGKVESWKQFPDASARKVEPWKTSRSSVHGPAEPAKEGPHVDDKDSSEAREDVGENKVDMKVEERFKDKDRKAKDKNDRWSNLQPGNSGSENKEVTKEEKDSEQGGAEKKELSKEKEKINEKEKDNVKKESWNGSDKEAPHNEIETVDVPGKAVEQENLTVEPKKRDCDPKTVDREVRDKKKEREGDVEPERPDKRVRYQEKESDDGSIHVEGGAERERDVSNSGVQQRKRMLLPRGSPQAGNRDSRLRTSANDNEGSQGKTGVSCVVYKVGECMQELVKLWEEYESQADKASEGSQTGPSLEIRIPAEHVTATNRQVRGGQLWGTDIYTVDSDLVAVLMHAGYCRPTASSPPSAAQELRATVRVLPPQECYISTLRNNVRSRAWGAAIGCSYRVERCCIVKKGGGIIDLEPCLTHSSTMEPTLAPVAVERTMTTRAAASNALRQQRFVREVTIQYNLCMEPWLKYSISAVADKGLKKSLFTSARLKKGEVLYVETHSRRYELCFNGEKPVKAATTASGAETGRTQNHSPHLANGEKNGGDVESVTVDTFRWSRCKKPLPQKTMLSVGIPLPLERVEVLEDNLEWDDFGWSQTGVWVAGKEYHLARAHFLAPN